MAAAVAGIYGLSDDQYGLFRNPKVFGERYHTQHPSYQHDKAVVESLL